MMSLESLIVRKQKKRKFYSKKQEQSSCMNFKKGRPETAHKVDNGDSITASEMTPYGDDHQVL
ncbi:hypothetical protein ACE1OE_09905 [Vibrio sp. E150_011]